MWRDTEPATTLENGERVPILALSRYLGSLANPSMPCLKAVDSLAWNIAAEFLDAAGKKRFLAKAKRFQVELAQTEAGQLLYRGIMGALGYSKNKIACLELARRLPLYVLESVAQGKLSDEECLAWQQALLLGTAGLLPSQRSHKYQKNIRDDEWVGRLEQLWAGCHHPEVMSESDWHLFKVRPNNVPVLRIAAMSYLVLRYRRRGIFEEMLRMVRQAPTRGGTAG